VALREATDAELWKAVRSGTGDALEALFDRHSRVVYNYCFRRVGNWSDAEELTSTVFLAAWQKRRSIDLAPDGSLLPWLLGAATNLIRNRSRRVARFARAVSQLRSQRGLEPDPADDVLGRLDDERTVRVLLARLRRLPRHEQEVIALYAWADLSYQEIAQALGVPIGTVRSRISRARARLASFADAPSNVSNSLAEGRQPHADH
jgi:RNA polymerase sigma factor (sigma-70 family)